MKSVTHAVLAAFAAVILLAAAGFVLFKTNPTATPVAVAQPRIDAAPRPSATATAQPQARFGSGFRPKQHASAKVRHGNAAPGPVAYRVPVEETPMAPPETNAPDNTVKAFNLAADALQKILSKLDKSSIFGSFDGVYALAVCGKTFIIASSDGSVVILQQSADGQMLETSSGTTCKLIGQKDNYRLAQLAIGAYVLTTPSGDEYTLGGAQNAEDDRKPFSSNPAAAATITTLASLQSELPSDHELYTTPDKRVAVVATGDKYVLIRSDGSREDLPSIGNTDYRVQTSEGTTCPFVAGDPKTSIGELTPEALIVKESDGTEIVVPRTASGNEYNAIPDIARDLNAIPPDLPGDPLFTPSQLEYTGLIHKNEWELSLSEQRILRRLLAGM